MPAIEKMHVYRVEHSKRKHGPFSKSRHDGTGIGLHVTQHREYEKMPAPSKDGLHRFRSNDRFAFPTIQAYVSFWNPSTLLDLQALGFVLCEYVVHPRHVLIGQSGWQLIYNCRASKKVAELDLLEPFDM